MWVQRTRALLCLVCPPCHTRCFMREAFVRLRPFTGTPTTSGFRCLCMTASRSYPHRSKQRSAGHPTSPPHVRAALLFVTSSFTRGDALFGFHERRRKNARCLQAAHGRRWPRGGDPDIKVLGKLLNRFMCSSRSYVLTVYQAPFPACPAPACDRDGRPHCHCRIPGVSRIRSQG